MPKKHEGTWIIRRDCPGVWLPAEGGQGPMRELKAGDTIPDDITEDELNLMSNVIETAPEGKNRKVQGRKEFNAERAEKAKAPKPEPKPKAVKTETKPAE